MTAEKADAAQHRDQSPPRHPLAHRTPPARLPAAGAAIVNGAQNNSGTSRAAAAVIVAPRASARPPRRRRLPQRSARAPRPRSFSAARIAHDAPRKKSRPLILAVGSTWISVLRGGGCTTRKIHRTRRLTLSASLNDKGTAAMVTAIQFFYQRHYPSVYRSN